MPDKLCLVSHHLCPYVQRAVIVAAEKRVAAERTFIDLAAKPDWFLEISPTGKVPLLRVTDESGAAHVLFESAAICEYLDEISPPPLLPADPIERAKVRAWVEFASGTLAEVAGLYGASDASAFDAKQAALRRRFAQVEAALAGPWFMGGDFGLVDAAFGPVFRYLDAFEVLASLHLASGLAKTAEWRASLAARPSIAGAVVADYPDRLAAFLRGRTSILGQIVAGRAAAGVGSVT